MRIVVPSMCAPLDELSSTSTLSTSYLFHFATDQIGSGQRYLIDIQNLAIFVVNSLGDGTYLKSSTISPLIAEPMRLTVSPKDLPAPFAL